MRTKDPRRRRRSRKRPRLALTPFVLVALGLSLAFAGACYAPTEVTIAVSTDLTCPKKPAEPDFRTAIYKGTFPQLDPDPETETSACTDGPPGGGDADIGTLVLLPSSSPDGRAGVKAVLTLNNKSASACDNDPTDCIVATRAFSFVAHTSRRIPIRLLKECLGTKCPSGTTCIGPNKCGSPEVTCVEGTGNCGIPTEQEQEQDKDAGGDARLDMDGQTGLDAGLIACGFVGGKGVLTTNVASPVLTAATTTDILWISQGPGATPQPKSLESVAKLGGLNATRTTITTVNEDVHTLGLNNQQSLLGWGGAGAQQKLRPGALADYQLGVGNVPRHVNGSGLGLAGGGFGGRLLVTTSSRVFELEAGTTSSFTQISLLDGSTGIEHGPEGIGFLIASSDKGIFRFDPGNGPAAVPSSPSSALLTSNGIDVFAAPSSAPSGSGQLFKLVKDIGAVPIAQLNFLPKSISADSTFVYGAFGSTILAYAINPVNAGPGLSSAARQVLVDNSGTIEHVMADANCIYYWVTDQNVSTLKVKSKLLPDDAGAP